MYVWYVLFNHVVGIIAFRRSVYRVKESAGPLQPEIFLSNPSSTDIIVGIEFTDITATGK